MSKHQDFDLLKPITTSPPQRPRHQIRRSITELSSPIKLPRYHHLHHQRKDRDNDDNNPQSANPMHLHLPRGSFELPRSEGTTPCANSETTLKFSMLNPSSDDATRSTKHTALVPNAVTEDELAHEEKEKVATSLAGLRKSLVELGDFSISTTMRLDDTYYSVLERLRILQNTIVSLKGLTTMSQELDESFKAESQGLVDELEQQAKSFGHFDDQQRRIEELQGRIHAGRDMVETLSKRVDVVRERIEGWERADMEWQEKTRKRLKIVWIITSVIVFSLILLLVIAQYAPSSGDISGVPDLTSSNEQGKPDLGNIVGNPTINAAALVDEMREALNSQNATKSTGNGVLRALDEL
ncbi:uncharacterized protein F4812DRAFT_451717 [Daldinia caldariorum]|uniref:uncharacterized protein n=1 Tax=Daldinia caldariorum TaxID=326644 RepID=UPI0020078A74|nr:uncharacterized protein F4812DRAFT_451717 [Daldinia caldariorum]KAI1466794.1 hypothetical protein F4812DRAFT_451717 [Daldinia caldariorum]